LAPSRSARWQSARSLGTLGAPRAFALNAIVALAVITPVAIPLVRGRGALGR